MSEWEEIRSRPANLALGKKLGAASWVVTVLVLLLVGMMRRVTIPLPDGVDLGMLPGFHALLNSMAAVLLVLALVAIKRRKILAHRRFVHGALICSCLFLVSYVVYHFTSGETLYGDADRNGVVDAAELKAVGSMIWTFPMNLRGSSVAWSSRKQEPYGPQCSSYSYSCRPVRGRIEYWLDPTHD